MKWMTLEKFNRTYVTTKEEEGREAARTAGSYFTADNLSRRASFIATMNLPSTAEPLRRKDFYDYDDYLYGFYNEWTKRVWDDLDMTRRESERLRRELAELRADIVKKTGHKISKAKSVKIKPKTRKKK